MFGIRRNRQNVLLEDLMKGVTNIVKKRPSKGSSEEKRIINHGKENCSERPEAIKRSQNCISHGSRLASLDLGVTRSQPVTRPVNAEPSSAMEEAVASPSLERERERAPVIVKYP